MILYFLSIPAMRIADVLVCIIVNWFNWKEISTCFRLVKEQCTKPRHGNDIKGGQAQTGTASCGTTESHEALH